MQHGKTGLIYSRVRRYRRSATLWSCLTAFIGYFHWASHAYNGPLPGTRSYAEEIKDAQQAGIPVTARALQASLPPPEQNAAPYYTQLTGLLAAHPLAQEDIILGYLTARELPSPEQFERVRQALKHRSDLLTLVHEATSRPQCVFVKDWSNPIAVRFDELPAMREASWLLAAESLLLAHDGKPLEAVKNQALGFTIAHHAENENYLIGYMDAVTIGSRTQRGLQNILYLAGSDPAVAEAVLSAVEETRTSYSLAQALRKEAGCDIVALLNLHASGPVYLKPFLGDTSLPAIQMKPQEWDRFINDNGALLLRLERKVIAVADLPYSQSEPVLRKITAEVEQDQDPRHVLILVLSMNYEQLAEMRARAPALTEVTRSAAALLAWKDRKGSFPQSLEEALTRVPPDPFTGKPLQYRREGAGFVVYSAGKDGRYTGGKRDKKPTGFDVVFRYPFPAYYQGPLKVE